MPSSHAGTSGGPRGSRDGHEVDMDPDEVGAALLEAVKAYHATRRHPDLPAIAVHPAQGVQAWWGSPESARPGCYAFFDAAGQLLYVGKASMGQRIGDRLFQHDHAKPRAWWRDAAAFVVLVPVGEAFEAPSLEEYLIDRLHPPGNVNGLGGIPVAAGPPWVLPPGNAPVESRRVESRPVSGPAWAPEGAGPGGEKAVGGS